MTNTKRIFICGSALQGQPDHGNLQSAKFIEATATVPHYRLHAAENGWHPAIYEVSPGGISIPGEVYEITEAEFAQLAATEPPHMYPQEVTLQDGSTAIAFLYPHDLIIKHNWPDISHHGGWAAYKLASAV